MTVSRVFQLPVGESGVVISHSASSLISSCGDVVLFIKDLSVDNPQRHPSSNPLGEKENVKTVEMVLKIY